MTSPFGQRILILVPHPDDEIVACAATIARAQAEGATIFAAYLTTGCVAHATLWPWQRKQHDGRIARRKLEAAQVAEQLGILPVMWSQCAARYLWRMLPQVLEEVNALIEQYQIDQIWVPAYEGGNADHDGLNAIGGYLSAMVSVLEFAEYNWLNGHCNNNRFPYPTPETISFELTPEERARKEALLKLYASEKLNLSYVTAARESFRQLKDYDYSKPPHPGLLWYMRFQWVPFHHPGIDRTRHTQVSRAIQALQEATGTLKR